jgi:hypothetical protein
VRRVRHCDRLEDLVAIAVKPRMLLAMITIKLPGRDDLLVNNLESTFKSIVAGCSDALNDKKISQQNFGADKHFFFKANGRTLIGDEGLFLENYTLREMRMKNGNVLEFCYVPGAVNA